MRLRNMMYISLFAAIIGVLGFFPPIMLPLIPVPITLQTLGVMLAGGVLGARRGGLSLLLLLLLIVIGVPLLSGGRGGIGPLIGPSGGYILSWPLAAWTIGYLVEKNWHSLNLAKVILFNFFGGIIIVYFCGVTYLSLVGNLSWGATAISSLIFLPGDLTKTVVSGYITMKISKTYPLVKKHASEKQLKRVG